MISPRDMSLRACALGFDARSYTALQLFFRGKCGDKAVLVGEDDADVSIVDMDSFNGAKILAEQRERHPGRPFILLSLNPPAEIPSGVIYIKKPVQIQSMLTALEQTAARLRAKAAPKAPAEKIRRDAESPAKPPVDAAPKPGASPVPARPAAPAIGFAAREDRDTSHAALSLDERGFGDYIGSLKDIDPSNPMEVTAAQYDPKRYFQGYLQSACKTALTKNCALRLNTGWKPVTIFPQSREIWVDADDQQLRSFCLVPVHSIAELGFSESDSGIMTISSASAVKFKEDGRDQSKLHRMDALIWKVALWTSAGRVPDDIDLNRPVYLRNWPNFTRLLVFPHALRIAALLSEQPRSLLNIAETLNIRQQYVFAFFSAARALGLADQAVRQSESLIAPLPVESKKDAGLFKKILQRLLRR
ncbi:hypothetical protein [Methylomagnum ishizawai]|uniref:hypothetical protein n=1 Tax=Methylomagnum ishizawai TaxID=1760988 RepID=UPI001C3397B9|nr:hypothetical protein [Methylomagnum ishizawai]BBL74757.1 hypothetical protein MishRS11D_18550 [Methylomagnum ishizawai]